MVVLTYRKMGFFLLRSYHRSYILYLFNKLAMGMKEEKPIETVEYWGKSHWETIGAVAVRYSGNEKSDWVLQRKLKHLGAFYQEFANIEGMKFNWLIKLWGKLNNL